jgi:hypothetical protein
MNNKYNPKRSNELETTSLPDGFAIIVNQKTSWAHTLSPLAALIWEFCDGQSSVDEIVASLQAIPEIGEKPSLKIEVEELIHQLGEDGFLVDDSDISA